MIELRPKDGNSFITVGDSACLDASKWISQGIMGQILESICDEALQTQQVQYYSYPLASSSTVASHPHHLTVPKPNSTKPLVAHKPPSSAPVVTDMFTTLESSTSTEGNNNISDSTSASTTPVSDTTASDSDAGETQPKQLGTNPDAVPMEESAPT